MRYCWMMLIVLFASLPLTFAGCSNQLPQDESDPYEEIHEGDDSEEGDVEPEEED